tara:strand:+ start:2998 stop:3483 length:486 start_codon:yes stop_codon:yes gene_type:complete
MDLYLKKIASASILGIGLILFFSSLLNNNINLALVSLISALIFWVLFGLIVDAFDVEVFSWVISGAGFLLSICVFFIYGIEQVPHPIGAIVFHSGGIAGSLGIGFFSLFPILIMYQINNTKKESSIINHDIDNNDDNTEIMSDDWEIVTEEELNSGDFEAK